MKYVLIMKYNKKKRESRNETHFISYIEQKGKEAGTKYIAAVKNNKKGKEAKMNYISTINCSRKDENNGNEVYFDDKIQHIITIKRTKGEDTICF